MTGHGARSAHSCILAYLQAPQASQQAPALIRYKMCANSRGTTLFKYRRSVRGWAAADLTTARFSHGIQPRGQLLVRGRNAENSPWPEDLTPYVPLPRVCSDPCRASFQAPRQWPDTKRHVGPPSFKGRDRGVRGLGKALGNRRHHDRDLVVATKPSTGPTMSTIARTTYTKVVHALGTAERQTDHQKFVEAMSRQAARLSVAFLTHLNPPRYAIADW